MKELQPKAGGRVSRQHALARLGQAATPISDLIVAKNDSAAEPSTHDPAGDFGFR
jgi:hypothetical protein